MATRDHGDRGQARCKEGEDLLFDTGGGVSSGNQLPSVRWGEIKGGLHTSLLEPNKTADPGHFLLEESNHLQAG